MNMENKISIRTLIYALIFLTFGIILLTSTEDLVTFASKIIGCVISVAGIVKVLVYVYRKGKFGNYSIFDLLIGICLITLGASLIIISSALSFIIRTVVGLWIILSGINRIIFAITVKSLDKKGFTVYLSTAIFMIIIGLLIMSAVLDQFIGLFIIVYSISEIANYIYYKVKYKNYEDLYTEEKPKKNELKKLKKGKVVDANYEEKED